MAGERKSFWKGAQTPEQKRLEIMRRANTEATNKHSINGRLKEPGKMPKPITLVKMPWDGENDT